MMWDKISFVGQLGIIFITIAVGFILAWLAVKYFK